MAGLVKPAKRSLQLARWQGADSVPTTVAAVHPWNNLLSPCKQTAPRLLVLATMAVSASAEERACSRQMRAVVCASSITLTPPASAAAVSPRPKPCAARCVATSDDEHAVSVLTHGPWNGKSLCDQHPHGCQGTAGTTSVAFPVHDGCSRCCTHSVHIQPTQGRTSACRSIPKMITCKPKV